jgi:hypothetical protein
MGLINMSHPKDLGLTVSQAQGNVFARPQGLELGS